MELNNREIKIIYTLLSLNQPVTTTELAKDYAVSSRTIKNDLNTIREWLSTRKTLLRSKPRVGIWFSGDQQQRDELKAKLSDQSGYEHFPIPQQRVHQIISLLSLSEGAVTIQQLGNKLKVSQSTILKDLDRTEKCLRQFHLTLEHKNFYGYAIQGHETDLRSCLETFIQSVIAGFDIYSVSDLLNLESSRKSAKLFLGLNNEYEYIFRQILTIAGNLSQQATCELDYNEILTLVCRLTISVARLSINEPINSYQELSQPTERPTFDYQLFQQVFQKYEFPLYGDEYAYVIRGTKEISRDKNLVDLTRKIIQSVSQAMNQPFDQDRQLQSSLLSHLMSKLNSKYQFTTEYNPFVGDIKRKYPELFGALQTICYREISSDPAIINDSFISFLALHFLVSLQKILDNSRKVRIIYVCSTGLGVTNLIQQQLAESLANVEIAGFTSLMNAQSKIEKLQPDLVVSIFQLKDSRGVPVIQVHPLPTQTDLAAIKAAVTQILQTQPTTVQLGNRKNQLEIHADGHPSKDSVRELLMNAFSIYIELESLLKTQISSDYHQAFMLHVFLAVYRITMDEQYQQMHHLYEIDEDLGATIRLLFQKYHLTVNISEIYGILEYTRLSQ